MFKTFIVNNLIGIVVLCSCIFSYVLLSKLEDKWSLANIYRPAATVWIDKMYECQSKQTNTEEYCEKLYPVERFNDLSIRFNRETKTITNQ